eukprot:357607-Chlamydomonas_euryale.AAC.1
MSCKEAEHVDPYHMPLTTLTLPHVHTSHGIKEAEHVAPYHTHTSHDIKEAAVVLNDSKIVGMHVAVRSVQEVFLTEHHFCIAMEYANSGNLFSYVQRRVRITVRRLIAWAGCDGPACKQHGQWHGCAWTMHRRACAPLCHVATWTMHCRACVDMFTRVRPSCRVAIAYICCHKLIVCYFQGKLQEPLARWFFQQLIMAIDYCHQKGVVNRDMKLENTLLQAMPNRVVLLKLCDFGYSKAYDQSNPKTKVGTSSCELCCKQQGSPPCHALP